MIECPECGAEVFEESDDGIWTCPECELEFEGDEE